MADIQQSPPTGETNALIDTAKLDDDGVAQCLEFLDASLSQRSNVFFISYTRTPDDWLQAWLTHVGARPVNLGFVQVGGTMRSTAMTTSASGRGLTPHGTPHPIQTVGNPTYVVSTTSHPIFVGERVAKRTTPVVRYTYLVHVPVDDVEILDDAFWETHIMAWAADHPEYRDESELPSVDPEYS